MKRQLDMLVEPAGGNGVFVKGDAMFLIFDDLTVLRSSPSVSFKPPLQLGHKEFRKVELLPYALHMLGGLSEVLPAIEVERMNYS